jgi:hypothetical protein
LTCGLKTVSEYTSEPILFDRHFSLHYARFRIVHCRG